MKRKHKIMLARIILSAAATFLLNIIHVEGFLKLALFCAVYLVIGYDILFDALRGIWNRRFLDENFLMAIATVGAFALAIYSGSGDYNEAVAVMLFYQTGELFQSIAVGKSRKNIAALMDIRPDYANVEVDGELCEVDPAEVAVGSLITVRPGERIPLDGSVVLGSSSLDTSALTGESRPSEVSEGDSVISGCVNMTGVLVIRTEKEFGESTVSRILELVENASSRKSKSEKFISKFARVYTPAVCASALALAVIPPALSLIIGGEAGWAEWLYRALTFLVISCPCALVISIPLTFFAGIGGASRDGILVKGSNYLEALAEVTTLAFDKTGTLTRGVFEVTDVIENSIERDKLIEIAAHAESASSHPIAKSLLSAYGKAPDRSRVENIREIGGMGITCEVDGVRVSVGNRKLIENAPDYSGASTAVYVEVDGKFAGIILISDVIKDNSKDAIASLGRIGIKRCVMLTGDSEPIAREVCRELGIAEYRAELLPGDKIAEVEGLLSDKGKVAFVGDGINDAPVLARADIGIAMGAVGSDAAIEAADVVLMNDDPAQIARAIACASKCIGIVKQNIIFSLAVKFGCLALVALGLANMWLGIFADVGVMVIAVLNATRALK
ncbi:MAG: cadmium-translocating P-type ATPase [Clostridia bacterium]|nr:cadmium-translocating P-type ATPase [Clostridia bacterium]